MKKIFVFLTLAALTMALLTGCTSSMTDADFIANLGKALEARWAITTSEEYSDDVLNSMSVSEYQDYCAMVVDTELEVIGNLEDYKFEDAGLKKLAKTDMKGLELQKEGAQYQGTDQYDQQQQTWFLGYDYRAVCMTELCNDYGLTVSEKYQKSMDDFLAYSATAAKEIAVLDYVDTLTNTLKYTKDEQNSDEELVCYTAAVENTTDFTINSMEIVIDFLDASGDVIYQTSDSLQNLQPGSTVQSSVYYEPDCGEFASMQYHISAYAG